MSMTDVLIAGGGLNGMTLAHALARYGLRVTLVDPAPTAKGDGSFDGRSYALALASQQMLAALGLWADLAATAQPIAEVKATDGRVGEGPAPHMLHFQRDGLAEGPMGFMVEDRHLRPILAQAMTSERITHLPGQRVTAQEVGQGHVTVTLSDGQTLETRLLIGCDGRSSEVAKRAGLKHVRWGYGQTAMVCAIGHDRPHHGVAHQFFMPEGPLAILPLTDNRSSIVWTESDGRADEINALPEAAYLALLQPRFGDFLGDIHLAGQRQAYPLGLSLAHRFISDRIALVGDAAHAIHPIAGQGLNLGLKDVAALTQVVVEARRRGEDFGRAQVLERYEQWRRFDTTLMAMATDGFNRLFSNDNGTLRLIRDLGMGAVTALPKLNRAFMREAAGLTGDRPKLLAGQPI